jgi:hypothetical protein
MNALNPAPISFRLAVGAQPLIALPVFVNGRGPFEFILDTAAGLCLATCSCLRGRNRRIVHPSGPLWRGASDARDWVCSLHGAWRRRGARSRRRATSALDIISAAIGQKLDGILGHNFLRLYRVIIDYPCGQINFGTAQG